MSLLIAMPGLPGKDATAPDRREDLPALPVLSAMLARARPLAAAMDWRAGVLGALRGAGGVAAIPDIVVAARALPEVPAGTALCFAAPLHVVAGISRVHLPPGGWLQLERDEAQRWMDAFNGEFGETGAGLHAAGNGWLLQAPFAAAARDPSPELLVGQPLAREAARDDAERALRRLGAEAEMWLAAHPLNGERAARQLPPLNNLWLWGGGHAAPLPAFERPARHVYVAGAADAWLTGLAAHGGASVAAINAWQQLDSTNDALLVLPPPPEGVSPAYWQHLEQAWFEPAASALANGSIDALRLQVGGRAWQLPDRSPLRWLRRKRPWHERLRA